jgi:hypothetical protein
MRTCLFVNVYVYVYVCECRHVGTAVLERKAALTNKERSNGLVIGCPASGWNTESVSLYLCIVRSSDSVCFRATCVLSNGHTFLIAGCWYQRCLFAWIFDHRGSLEFRVGVSIMWENDCIICSDMHLFRPQTYPLKTKYSRISSFMTRLSLLSSGFACTCHFCKGKSCKGLTSWLASGFREKRRSLKVPMDRQRG